MIITRIYTWMKEKDEDIVADLVMSMVVTGLVMGLILGLAVGLSYISSLMSITLLSVIVLGMGIVVLGEILFGFNEKQKRISWGKLIWLTIDAVFSSALIIINLLNIIWIINHIQEEQIKKIAEWSWYLILYLKIGIIWLLVVGILVYLLLLWNKKRITK